MRAIVLQWKHKCAVVLTCNKGGDTQIYFDPNNKSPSDISQWKERRMIITSVEVGGKKTSIILADPLSHHGPF